MLLNYYLLGTSALTTSARFVPPWDSSELGRKYPCGINYLQIALRLHFTFQREILQNSRAGCPRIQGGVWNQNHAQVTETKAGGFLSTQKPTENFQPWRTLSPVSV